MPRENFIQKYAVVSEEMLLFFRLWQLPCIDAWQVTKIYTVYFDFCHFYCFGVKCQIGLVNIHKVHLDDCSQVLLCFCVFPNFYLGCHAKIHVYNGTKGLFN